MENVLSVEQSTPLPKKVRILRGLAIVFLLLELLYPIIAFQLTTIWTLAPIDSLCFALFLLMCIFISSSKQIRIISAVLCVNVLLSGGLSFCDYLNNPYLTPLTEISEATAKLLNTVSAIYRNYPATYITVICVFLLLTNRLNDKESRSWLAVYMAIMLYTTVFFMNGSELIVNFGTEYNLYYFAGDILSMLAFWNIVSSPLYAGYKAENNRYKWFSDVPKRHWIAGAVSIPVVLLLVYVQGLFL
ncbi:MAG: hypothetical protein J6K90_00655 [Tidjanibacter sp.]|nr:hypothetical protein [Tidjanibacter sp.]